MMEDDFVLLGSGEVPGEVPVELPAELAAAGEPRAPAPTEEVAAEELVQPAADEPATVVAARPAQARQFGAHRLLCTTLALGALAAGLGGFGAPPRSLVAPSPVIPVADEPSFAQHCQAGSEDADCQAGYEDAGSSPSVAELTEALALERQRASQYESDLHVVSAKLDNAVSQLSYSISLSAKWERVARAGIASHHKWKELLKQRDQKWRARKAELQRRAAFASECRSATKQRKAAVRTARKNATKHAPKSAPKQAAHAPLTSSPGLAMLTSAGQITGRT
ncbi:hypothetical protein T492DRAFT_1139349 [Pavlovales sp. CCMP2436]|nr:hypothetical protein T492DRAFT_1139349 [Pavlovales sp. CCMP2436]